MKKFFEVNVGVEKLNEALYLFLISNVNVVDVTNVEVVTDGLRQTITNYFNVPEIAQMYKVSCASGKVFYVAANMYTKETDATYQEFLAWLEAENLIEDLDSSYDEYLEENNISPNIVEEVNYSFEYFAPETIIGPIEKEIEDIKFKYTKLLPMLEQQVENYKAELL